MRHTLLLLALCAGLAVPAAAQGLTIERDGSDVVLTLPDGTTERFTLDEDAPLRIRSKNGPLEVERDRPRAFAFRARPGDRSSAFEDLGLDDEASVRRLFRAQAGDRARGLDRRGADLLPGLPGFGMRGVDPETRRAIADGERESRALARQLRRAEGDEARDTLADELRQTLGRTFDLKQQARQERIERLEAEAERLRAQRAELEAETAERGEARRDIIERRRQELLGERDELDW